MRAGWAEAMGACAVLWIAVPLASQLTTERGLQASLISRDWVYVAFDLMALSVAFAFALAARKIAVHQPKRPPRRTAQAAEVLP